MTNSAQTPRKECRMNLAKELTIKQSQSHKGYCTALLSAPAKEQLDELHHQTKLPRARLLEIAIKLLSEEMQDNG